jgi:hypothetical protein
MRKKEAEYSFTEEYLPSIPKDNITSIGSEWTRYLGWLYDHQKISLIQLESWNKPHRYNEKREEI